MKTLKDMLAEARAVVPEEGPADLQRRLAGGEPVTVIDVRDPDEHREGYIEPATNVSRGFLEFRIGSVAPDVNTPIVVYCQTGLRSMLSAKALKDLGYGNVVNLQGGYQRWVQSGLPVVKDAPMGTEQLQRYSRHFLLAQVGEKGQRKLLRSKVLLIGAGGLGSPTALYLAAAGVGTLGVMDGDVVDITNLQRQVLHTTADIGKPKVESGSRTLRALNPDVKVVAIPERITADNALELIADYDVVVDGSDNFGTRYLVNDACYLAGKPQVHGSIFQFEGMASVFAPNQGPCYRCLYPTPPPPGLVPSCAEAGVLGVLPGMIGLVQATETIKLLLGLGEPLVGRLLTYDALGMRFREVRLRRDPGCPLCGVAPSIKDLSGHSADASLYCEAPADVAVSAGVRGGSA
ncbi:MAG: molybdopterin-synthase adenylyltransferase MoeB [Candidatus Rokuibacteriota bacterium]|jgi:molybdopterin/thiamine biosynthesis adenylyltransferase/rhodanese-related sulfurtransferase|nr:MAG: molybdopterin-synthase adenylyltransferase MoeB [Candidatus Rokubacteria bacterium]